jgi:hypothetical protein
LNPETFHGRGRIRLKAIEYVLKIEQVDERPRWEVSWMKYTPTDVTALTVVEIDPYRDNRGFYSCPSRRPTAGMPRVWVVGAEPEL